MGGGAAGPGGVAGPYQARKAVPVQWHGPAVDCRPRAGSRTLPYNGRRGRPEPQGTVECGLGRVPEWHSRWPTYANEAGEPCGPSSRAAGRCSPARRLAAARRPNGGTRCSTRVRGQLVQLKRHTVRGTDCVPPKADVVTMDSAAAAAASISGSIVEKAAEDSQTCVYPLIRSLGHPH